MDIHGPKLECSDSNFEQLIMDWRWRAAAARVDPAQLKTSVNDYLLPKMDLGLMFANVCEKMCNAWLSTIMHTLCCGFSTVSNINKKAFCMLAGIPDIFMRMQTSRVVDLIVNLNTRVGAHGSTTRARFCNLMGVPGSDLQAAIEKLASGGTLTREVESWDSHLELGSLPSTN